MNEALRIVAALAAGQHEVFSRAQAEAAGLSRWALGRHQDSGALVRVGPRTWRFAGTALTWRGQLQAGLLDLGDGALVAGRSAAGLFALDGFVEGPLEFLVPRQRRNRSISGIIHCGPPVPPTDRATVAGLPCVSATVAVIQVAAGGDRNATANALDSAVRLRLTSAEFLRRRLDETYRGVAGTAMLDDLLRDAGVESWLERRFLALVRAAGLPRPSLQRVYRRDGHHVARVDFDFAPWPIVVEVGGQKGYLTTSERQRQDRRRNELQLAGKIAYFFSYDDVVTDPGYVAGTVRSALDATSRAAS